MKEKSVMIPIEQVERTILLIRRQKVILDSDLAKLYGVSTKRLNEQVRRNRDRFPNDLMFQLTREEKAEVVANCDHLSRWFRGERGPCSIWQTSKRKLAAQ